jgi:hypothetical protein
VFLIQQSDSEIKPVEPGQGNACEGKKLNSFFNAAFPLHFLIKKQKNEEVFYFNWDSDDPNFLCTRSEQKRQYSN